jgi:diaminopimelate decarboxylase
LLAHVLYLKNRKGNTIAITDAGMSELIRPALYDAVHQILPVEKKDTKQIYDIVGPICESGDFFAKKYEMTGINEGDSIVIAHAGAYGSVMSSNYNSRPFVPEILITGNEFTVIRKPQLPESIFSLEV